MKFKKSGVKLFIEDAKTKYTVLVWEIPDLVIVLVQLVEISN